MSLGPSPSPRRLTELFAPDLMAERIRAFERHYTWVPAWGLEYFRARLDPGAGRLGRGTGTDPDPLHNRDLQERAVAALEQKCRILWSMLDAIMAAYGAGTAGESSVDDSRRPWPGRARREPGRTARPSDRSPGPAWPRGPHRTRPARGRMVLLYPEGVPPARPDGQPASSSLCDGQRRSMRSSRSWPRPTRT